MEQLGRGKVAEGQQGSATSRPQGLAGADACTRAGAFVQGQNLNPWQGLKLMTLPAGTMLILMSMALESREMASKGASERAR